jgi:O-antigen ligase
MFSLNAPGISWRTGEQFVALRRPFPAIVQGSFLLFVVTLPFEAAELPFMTGFLSVAKISGLVLAASYYFYFNPIVKRAAGLPAPAALRCFWLYLLVYAAVGLFSAGPDMMRFLYGGLTRLQLIVLFAIVSILLTRPRLVKWFCLLFVAASTLLSVGMIFNLFGIVPELRQPDRLTALGYNFNTVSGLLAVAVVVVVGLLINRTFQRIRPNLLLLACLLPLAKAMVATGSRSGMATALIGCLIYVATVRQSNRRFLSVAVSVFGLCAVLYLAAGNTVVSQRWQKFYYEEDLSGRSSIYLTAMDMAVERPLFGWGPVNHWYELGRRTGDLWGVRDEHNLVLFLLLEVGLVGKIPVIVGVALIVHSDWRGRRGILGVLPLAVLAALGANNLVENGLGLTGKLFWLVLALAAAAPSHAPRLRPASIRGETKNDEI